MTSCSSKNNIGMKGEGEMENNKNTNVDNFIDIYFYMNDILDCLMKSERTEIKYISEIEKTERITFRNVN